MRPVAQLALACSPLLALLGCSDSQTAAAPSKAASNAAESSAVETDRAPVPGQLPGDNQAGHARPESSALLANNVRALVDGTLDWERIEYHCDFCALILRGEDRLVGAIERGIVWHGVWEDALDEVRRTGRPLLLHFGSPRCMQVPGVW